MALEPLAGKRMTKVTERRTKIDWAQFLADIAAHYVDAAKIVLVMDNLNTHRPGALYEAYPPAQAKALWDRFEFVFTPKHVSWLNVAEVEINVMVNQCLKRPHRFHLRAASRSRRLAGQAGSSPSQGRLAVHHRRRTAEAQASLSDIRRLTRH